MSIRSADLGMPFPTLGDEPWQRLAVNRALDTFGPFKTPSRIFTAVRQAPPIIDYFEQAPVLGSIGLSNKCVDEMRAGARLKNVIRRAGGSNPLRQFLGKVCSSSFETTFRWLAAMNPSVVAQAIPEDAGRQRAFLSNCDSFRIGNPPEAPLSEWFVGRIAPDTIHSCHSMVDYIKRSGRPVDLRWSADEARAATTRWHDELAKMTSEERFFAKHHIGFDEDVDYGTFPVVEERAGLQFIALRSGKSLYEDGRSMHHCVGSYSSDVITGKSRIYSIRRGEKRIATMEIALRGQSAWSLKQVCGPCNARPDEDTLAAAKALTDKITTALKSRRS